MNRSSFANSNIVFDERPGLTFNIQKEIGRGASCIVYHTVASDGTEHLLKEYHPKHLDLSRNDSGQIVVAEAKQDLFDQGLVRFRTGCERQKSIRLSNESLKNFTCNVQGYYAANGTEYIDMTCFNGQTYDHVQEKSVYNLMLRMRTLAQVVGNYHKDGLLHLDIKPENIYVRPADETIEDVMLFDFDSVTPIDEICTSKALSCTKTWAATEQLLPQKRASICPATDLFAIGEIIFVQLFGRHSTNAERRSFVSSYNYDHDAEIFKHMNPKAFPLLDDLLCHTICGVVDKRYQSADELIAKLDEIIKLADPKEPWLISSAVKPKTFFIGREAELDAIHNNFQKSNIQFLSGIGGIGKSELAKNYAKLHLENGNYDTIFFATYNGSWMMLINDDSSIHIANFERFPEEKEPDYYRRKIRKLKELSNQRTLLIIDNLNEDEFDGESQAQWEDILSLDCKLLITTRLREWSHPILDVDILSQRNHLVDLFENYYSIKTEDELAAVQEIIDYVNGHTLTIELIARQTKANFSTPAKILDKLQSHGIAQSSKGKIVSEKDNQQSRKTAFEHISALFDIASLNEQEKYVLANMSLIPVDGISAERFAEWCELEDYDVVNILIGSGWLERNEDIIKMHPVIAEVALEVCLRVDISRCDKILCNQVQYLENYTDKDLYNDAKTTLNDVVFFTNTAERLIYTKIDLENIAILLSNTTSFIMDFGHLKKAEFYCLHALKMRRKMFGNEYRGVAICLNNLGILNERQGNFGEAEQYYLQSLDIDCKLFGNEHEGIATTLNNLGILYESAGKLKEAEQCYQQALKIRIKLYGDEHPDVASSLNALGSFYGFMGNQEKEEQYYIKALTIRQKYFGNEHPVVAVCLNNLGVLYESMGAMDKAEQYLLKSFEIRKKFFGGEHPDTASSLGNLGALYKSMGDMDKAEQYFLHSLEIRRKLFGDKHPDVALSIQRLGDLYASTGDIKKAEQYCLQALELRQNLFGNTHPKVAISLNNLGALYKTIRNFEKAEQYYLDAVNISKRTFDNNHPHVAIYLSNLGDLYLYTEDFEKAEQCFLQALELRQNLFGDEHAEVASCYNKLGIVYKRMRDFEKAEQYYLQALIISKKLLRNDHPHTATYLNNLSKLYKAKGDTKKAEQYRLQAREISAKN